MDPIPDELAALAGKYGLRDVYAFGSRSADIAGRGGVGDSDPSESDLDVGVQPLPGRTLAARDRVRLAGELEALFRVPRVDLVVLPEASAFLAFEVVSGELLYTSDEHAQAEYELYVLRRAADLAPFRRDRVRQILTSGAR